MRHIVETGTDIAIIGFFDAATLPKNYAAQAKADQMGLFARLSQAGCLWYVETGSDGAYLFHFYVEEPLPELVRKYSEEPKTIPRFQVPSGELWACGAEYISPDPRVGRNFGPEGGLGKYPHMGGSFRIPAGEYEVTVWRTEWPDELIEDKIKDFKITYGPYLTLKHAISIALEFLPRILKIDRIPYKEYNFKILEVLLTEEGWELVEEKIFGDEQFRLEDLDEQNEL